MATHGGATESNPYRGGLILLGAVVLYYGLQTLLRLFVTPALGIDDSELMVTSQAYAAGYGSQPPLISWLQRAIFELFGHSVLSLALSKSILLFLAFLFVYLAARLVFGRDEKAVPATLALFTIPQLAWESLGSLTHTVIAVATGAASIYVFLRLLRDGKLWAYLAFGVTIALGVLSKYNYVILLVSLVAAALADPAFRRRIVDWRMLLAVFVAVVMLLPHFVWVADNLAASLARTRKFDIAKEASLLSAWGAGIGAYVSAIIGYAAVPVVVFLIAAYVPLGRARTTAALAAGPNPYARLLIRTLVIAAGLILIGILAGRVRHFPDRWLHPVFFILPIALFGVFAGRIDHTRARLLGWISGGLGIACLIGFSAFHIVPEPFGHAPHENAPFDRIAAEIEARGIERSYIIADNFYDAGNLKLRFPESTVAEKEYGLWPTGDGAAPDQFLLAWSDQEKGQIEGLLDTIRATCADAATPLPDPAGLAVRTLKFSYARMRSAEYTLHVATVPACGAIPARR